MLTGATVINCCFEIDAFYPLDGILKQALEHVRFNRIRRFSVSEFDGTHQPIFKVRMVSFNVEGDITERERCPERLNEILIQQVTDNTYTDS